MCQWAGKKFIEIRDEWRLSVFHVLDICCLFVLLPYVSLEKKAENTSVLSMYA